ncbi:MAG: 50S ribosomal protein L21 [Bdellovibrionota bacterium]
MYAIIRAGGKQYTVRAGDTVRVAKMAQDLGSEIDLKDILLVNGDQLHVGEPVLSGAVVTCVVTRQDRGEKIIVFKKKRRQGYRRTNGHRQDFTELFVKSITSPTGEVSKADNKAQVIDPAKTAERRAMHEAKLADMPRAERKAKTVAKKAKAAPKKAAKKSSGKKPKAKTAKKKAVKK